jgi:hypothetical protein
MDEKPTGRADLIELAKTLRRRLDTLYTLGSSNDPLMVDQDYRSKHAYWIAELFQRMELPRRIHVRQIPYKLISQETPVPQVDGTPYVNSSDCFNRLCDAIRDARYLGLIPEDAIIDRRNPEPTINHVCDGGDVAAEVSVTDGDVECHRFGGEYAPPTINVPETSLLQEPMVGQRYHLEIWIEKSTANEVLLPLGTEYGINVATFIGEVSATACKNLVDRAIASERPVRILHVTDFDPAGRDMPISAAVKIDFFAGQSGVDLDIRLEHVALSQEQCIEYRLPRTPIKDSEPRAASFEARYGAGATELDALEALHPGALRRILIQHIHRYFDPDINAEVDVAVERYRDELDSAEALIEEQFSEQLADINGQRERIAAAFERVHGPAQAAFNRIFRLAHARYIRALERVRGEIDEMEDRLVTQAETLLARMKAALEEAVPDPDLFDWPEAAEGDEDDDALYDSTRGYVEQVDRFRDYRGDDVDTGLAIDRVVIKTCALCGESFSTANPRKVFCSSRCTNKSSRKARRGGGSPQAA